MKKIYAALILVMWSAASVSMAQNSVPYQNTFEDYAVGYNLIGTVWQGDTNVSVATVSNATPPVPSAGYPIPGATHTNAMFSEGTLTNEFDGSTSNLTVVAIDMMIKPVFAERPEGGQMMAVSNSQVSLYVDTNGYVNVFHAIMTGGLPSDPPGGGWDWTTLTNTTAIATGAWARMTVVMNYDSVINGPVSMFKVAINGTFINSPDGFVLPDVGSSPNGPWFASPKSDVNDLRMHSVVLSGSGALDDLVVTNGNITFTGGPVEPGPFTNGVTYAWLVSQGITTNATYPTWDAAALADQDGDGAATWAEYIAGTQPTNPASKLIIVSQTISNGFPILKWIGTTNAHYPYLIQWSSNLMSISAWTTVTNNLPQTEGTNEATITLPPAVPSPAFLRVNVTTNSP